MAAPDTSFVLNSVCIIEQDVNQDTIISWTFPTTDKYIPSDVILQRCPLKNQAIANGFEEGAQNLFLFSKYESSWMYTTVQRVENHKILTNFAIVLIAKVTKF